MARAVDDVRYALRILRKSPGFTLVAVLTIALGIGANVMNFAFGNAVLFRPNPVIGHPEQLVRLHETTDEEPSHADVTYANYRVYRERAQSFTGIGVARYVPVVLSGDGPAIRLSGDLISANYFTVLEVVPVLGRTFFSKEASVPGSSPVAMISYGLWERRFGKDPSVLRRSLRLNGREYSIVGVAPAGFRGVELFSDAEVWIPITMFRDFSVGVPGSNLLEDGGERSMTTVGRLKDGVTLEQAQAELRTIAAQNEARDPKNNRKLSLMLAARINLVPGFRGDLAGLFTVGTTLVGVLLLIATANLANLLLARATVRRTEIAVRLAIGATPTHILRQLLTESLVLAALGALAALGLAALLAEYPTLITGPLPFRSAIDGRVLAFTLAIALATGVVMGLAPALRSGRTDLISGLKGRALHLYGVSRLRNLLVIGQVALTVSLLGVSSMLVKTMANANRVDVGFDTHRIILAQNDLPRNRYTEEKARLFLDRAIRAAAGIPGVQSAAMASGSPVNSWMITQPLVAEGKSLTVGKHTVSQGYFKTLGVPILHGREFLRTDTPSSQRVAVVNESLARHIWGRTDVVGSRVELVSSLGNRTVQVAGVSKDIVHGEPQTGPRPWIYVALAQNHEPDAILHVNARNSGRETRNAIQKALQTLDPDLPVAEIRTVRDSLKEAFVSQRLLAWNSAGFGVIALLMATLGVYGVIAYSVSQRTQEYGVRLALGATSSDIGRLVLRQAMVMIALGIPIGLAFTAAGGKIVKSYLLGVSEADPLSMLIPPVVIAAVTLLAAYTPARRAMKVNPVDALRAE